MQKTLSFNARILTNIQKSRDFYLLGKGINISTAALRYEFHKGNTISD